MSQLTAQGFKRKRYSDYITELEALARELFGADVDLSDYSPLGQWVKLLAYREAETSELIEAVYNSADVDRAEGVSLDYAVKFKGITRFAERPAYLENLTLLVDPGLTIEPGLLVGTLGGIQFFTLETVTDSDNDGIVIAAIEAIEPGAIGNVPANTINEILTPRSGINSVYNSTKLAGGQDRETDAELRNRYKATTGENGTPDGIATKLMNNVAGVRAALVIDNVEDVEDADGRPAHSFEAIVLGGSIDDIGAMLLQVKPVGIRAYGSETVIVKDKAGNDQIIGFSYATKKDIYVKITLIKNSAFPTSGIDIIKLETIKYIGGSDSNNNFYAGLGMGDDVKIGKISSIAWTSVAGVADAVIEVSTDGINYTVENIPIQKTEVAQTDFDKVVITVE